MVRQATTPISSGRERNEEDVKREASLTLRTVRFGDEERRGHARLQEATPTLSSTPTLCDLRERFLKSGEVRVLRQDLLEVAARHRRLVFSEVHLCAFPERLVSDEWVATPRAKGFLERLAGRIVEALVRERCPSVDAEQCRRVIGVRNAFGQRDYVIASTERAVQLGKRHRGDARRFELLDGDCRPCDVAGVLIQLGKREPDDVAVDRKRRADARGDAELNVRSCDVLAEERVLCRVLSGRVDALEQVARLRVLMAPDEAESRERRCDDRDVGVCLRDGFHRCRVVRGKCCVQLLLALRREPARLGGVRHWR